MEGDQSSGQEGLVLLLQGEGEPVDDGPQDLEELGDPVVPLRLVDELEEDVVDGSTDERSEVEELPVDSVEGGFEEVSFSRIFTVEEFQQLKEITKERANPPHQGQYNKPHSTPSILPSSPITHLKNKRLINELLPQIRTEIRTLDESQEELVDDLQVRPSQLEDGLVLFRVEGVPRWVDLRRDRSEEVRGELIE